MICPNCGMQLPDDSEFCQYCGSKATAPVEPVQPIVEIVPSAQSAIQKAVPAVEISDSLSEHQNESNTQQIEARDQKKDSKKSVVLAICLAVLLLVSGGLNIYQYMSAQANVAKVSEMSGTIADQAGQIESLNSTISDKDTQIKNKSTEITNLKNKVSSLENDAENYDTLISAIKYGNLGYASSNFQSSESVIVVGRNEKNRKFTLTAHWSNGGNVSVDYDTYLPAAYVDFDQNSWSTSTKMTIEPRHSGITVVTFSNDVNRQTFDVIIIVE